MLQTLQVTCHHLFPAKKCYMSLFSSLGESLAETYLDSGGSLSSFCNQIFAGWDFCITNEKTAQEKELSFLQNVKVCLL